MSSGKGRKKSRRGQGESEKRGVTNARIITYIADVDDSNSSGVDDYDIVLHLKREWDIKDNRTPEDHITDLLEWGYITEVYRPDGSKYYRLPDDFEHFHEIFNYCHKGKCSTGFVQTKYYNNLLDRPEFRAKLIINMVKATMLYLLDYPQDKHEYRDLLKEARSMAVKSPASVVIRKMFGVITDLNRLSEAGKITGKPSNEISPAVLQLSEFVKNHDIDQIYDNITVQLGIDDSIMTGVISQSDWQAMVRILQCSPSAMDTVLNQTSYNPVLFAVSTLRYYTLAILKDPAKMALINDISAKQNDDYSKADAVAAMKLLMDFSKIDNSAPIINILLAEMTRDYHKGCLAKTPFSVRAVKELFEPHLREERP
jgi:hypothetical protein